MTGTNPAPENMPPCARGCGTMSSESNTGRGRKAGGRRRWRTNKARERQHFFCWQAFSSGSWEVPAGGPGLGGRAGFPLGRVQQAESTMSESWKKWVDVALDAPTASERAILKKFTPPSSGCFQPGSGHFCNHAALGILPGQCPFVAGAGRFFSVLWLRHICRGCLDSGAVQPWRWLGPAAFTTHRESRVAAHHSWALVFKHRR